MTRPVLTAQSWIVLSSILEAGVFPVRAEGQEDGADILAVDSKIRFRLRLRPCRVGRNNTGAVITSGIRGSAPSPGDPLYNRVLRHQLLTQA